MIKNVIKPCLDIKLLIKEGENQTIEFKTSFDKEVIETNF